MKKYNRLFAGLAAVAIMASCSTEEPVTIEKQQGKTPVGDLAFMAVKISAVDDAAGRADATDFAYGTTAEQRVNQAGFYFFDENGVNLNIQAYATDIDADFETTDPADKNVEYIGNKNILVLEELTQKGYPRYMLTVLNAPDFEPAATLDATLAVLGNYGTSLAASGTTQPYMVMSTSAYYEDAATATSTHDKYPFVTVLTDDDFYTSREDAVDAQNAVDVYVERLAAKIQFTTDPSLVAVPGMANTYKFAQTVGGGADDQNTFIGDDGITADTDIYCKIVGWALNTTAPDSYVCKNIQNTWTNIFDEWNGADRYRSYWAKGVNYGIDGGNYNYVNSRVFAPGYVANAEDLYQKQALGEYAYCNENTNTAAIAAPDGTVNNQVVTNVVLYTQVVDESGAGVTMVSAYGVLYTQKAYIDYILNGIDRGNKALNLFYVNPESTAVTDADHYLQVDATFFKLDKPATAGLPTGYCEVVLDEDNATISSGDLYTYNASAAGTEADPKYTKVEGAARTAAIDAVKAQLTAAQPAYDGNAAGGNYATVLDNGYNVYYIPVEHLGAATQDMTTEGYYGVVRNHWYELALTKISRIGHGIWDPSKGGEILTPPNKENPLYYVGANIRVLSWRLVKQSVEI